MAVKMNSEHTQTIYDSTGIFSIKIQETLKGDGTHIFDSITFRRDGKEFLSIYNLQDVEILYEILYAAGIYLKHGVGLKMQE